MGPPKQADLESVSREVGRMGCSRGRESDVQSHDRITQARDRDIGNQVTNRITHGEHRQAEDRLGHTENDTSRFEDSDNLFSNRRDPRYGNYKAEEAEKEVVSWLGVRGSRKKQHGEKYERDQK